MNVLKKIYDTMPVWVQNLMCSVKGYTILKRRYNKSFIEELRRFESREYNPKEELRRFLLAIKEVPAYNGILTDEDIAILEENPENVYKIIKRYPIIDKAYVKEHLYDFNNLDYVGDTFVSKTSGTTGVSLSFVYPVEFENKQWAVWWRYRRALGISLDDWQGWFGGKMIISADCSKGPYWRINYPGKQVMFSSYHINQHTISFYHQEIIKRKLKWLHGYPSTIAELSSQIVKAGLPEIDSVTIITTGAENLSDYQIFQMSKAFPHAIIRTHYGLSEGVANMSQDKEGEWRVDNDFCYVEFEPTDDGGLCRIIGTGFWNQAFPLVRYDTGDLATVERDVEGNVIRIISVDGRQSDFLTLPDGRRVGPLNQVLKVCEHIVSIQFVQQKGGEVIVKVVCDTDYTDKDERQLRKSLEERLKGDFNYRIDYVSSIEKTKSGKSKLVISEL